MDPTLKEISTSRFNFWRWGVPLCIALNMIDVATSRGITIDEKKLSKLIGVPVVPMIARSGVGKKRDYGHRQANCRKKIITAPSFH